MMDEASRRGVCKAAIALLASQWLPTMAGAQGRTGGNPVDPLSFIDPVLRPSAAKILEMTRQRGAPSDNTLSSLRNVPPEFIPPRLADVPVEERRIPGAPGTPEVVIYIVNAGQGGARPAILHTHGGGYIAGTAKAEVGNLQKLARHLDCVIVTVEYRLAPETRYVGSIEDTYAALRWTHGNARMLGIDPDKIALLGESAGGGHAARLAITARDRKEVPVLFQALIYPMLDDRTGSTIIPRAPIGTVGWDAASNRYGWQSFLGMAPGGSGVPAAAVPARVEDLRGLPPAFIGVGSVDLFVGEDISYAKRLLDAGVDCSLLVVPGAYHGFDVVAADTLPAQRFTQAKQEALLRAFGGAERAVRAG